MNQKKIYEIIFQNNLYPYDNRTYVQPFTDGSYLFWNKELSFTQYINDVNKRLYQFYKNIRQKNYSFDNLIYYDQQLEINNINQILNSNFYKRMDRTYIFDRSYIDVIKATDDERTFYYCQIQSIDEQIINNFMNIKGKFLIVTKKIQKHLNNINVMDFLIDNQDYYFIFNYNAQKRQDLF